MCCATIVVVTSFPGSLPTHSAMQAAWKSLLKELYHYHGLVKIDIINAMPSVQTISYALVMRVKRDDDLSRRGLGWVKQRLAQLKIEYAKQSNT